ncbi:hypothetical protein [Mesorhizobium sp.]|uniref:hypothetical protein n=1 Tax=Mesorhizobium sp. TaxID=1871066 RepID=UPI0025FC237B|nr:hypothetical protein [Mesorhizobium sp.]
MNAVGGAFKKSNRAFWLSVLARFPTDFQSTFQIADPCQQGLLFSRRQLIALSGRAAMLRGNRIVGSVRSIVFFLHSYLPIQKINAA